MKPTREQQLKRYHMLKLGVFLGLLGLGFLILLKVENMLLSSLLAFCMSYLLSPLVDALERAGLTRLYAIIVTFLIAGLTFVVGITACLPFVSSQASAFKAELPKYIEGVTNLIWEVENTVQHISGAKYSLNLGERAQTLLTSWTGSFFGDLPGLVSTSITTLLLAPFLAFFLLKDGRMVSRNLLSLVPNHLFELTLNLHHQINDQMAQFVRARLLEALIVGVVVWLGLWMIDFRYASLLALFAALTNLIPYIGPIIGAVPAIIISLINGDSTLELFLLISVYGVAQAIDVFFIIPLVVAKIVNLHPVTVVIALLVGAQLMGVIGMLVAIPVASVLKVTSTSVYKHLTQFQA